MIEEIKEVLLNEDVLILSQVVAETFYVLGKIYNVDRKKAVNMFLDFLEMESVHLDNEHILLCAITEYKNTNLDFVDVLLYSYQKHMGIEVITFDRKLQAKLKGLEIVE